MESFATASMARLPRNGLYFAAGIVFLALAKAKYVLKGYSTPKPFALADTDRCIDYNAKVAKELLGHLRSYGGGIEHAHVLELGPGSDLGVGLYLLGQGAASYVGFDRHNLAAGVPREFYARLGKRLGIPVDLTRARYVARTDFDIAAELPPHSIDVVLSNAAFEHFDDVACTVRQLSRVVKPGGKIAAVIDLQTHSRWIREKDPNNISATRGRGSHRSLRPCATRWNTSPGAPLPPFLKVPSRGMSKTRRRLRLGPEGRPFRAPKE
jgi:SAM-dependent methyltransferase